MNKVDTLWRLKIRQYLSLLISSLNKFKSANNYAKESTCKNIQSKKFTYLIENSIIIFKIYHLLSKKIIYNII